MKSYRTHLSWISLVVMVVVAGCDSGASSGGNSDMDALAAQLDQAKQAEANAKAAAEVAAAKAAADAKAAEEAAQRQAQQQAAEQAAAAQAGRTTAGAGTVGEGGGYMSAIVAAHRHITTRVDNLAWTQALQHHKASTGEMPKNHEEFMQIMAEMGIPLPELEQGQELFWDPSEGIWGTLYIVEPNPAAAPPAQ